MTSQVTGDDRLMGLVGAPVEILLESTPGTGAIWYAPPAPLHSSIDSRDARPMGTGIGGSAQQVFVFRAEAPGTYALTFQLKREWETSVRRERRFVISIKPSAA